MVIIMEFESVIKSRSSTRDFSDKIVEEEKINFILECARLAPSWANRQCWHFIVVKDKKVIEDLSKTSMINRWLKNVPVIIVACGDSTQSGSRNDINYFVVDVSIALEHLVLAATDKGLGTCWIAGFDGKKVKKIPGIPKHIRLSLYHHLVILQKKTVLLKSYLRLLHKIKKEKVLIK